MTRLRLGLEWGWLVWVLACGGVDPVLPDADPGDLSPYVFDDSVVRTYELDIAPADWQWLNDNATLEQYVPGTLTFEGQIYADIGVRYKGGFGTLRNCFDSMGNRTCSKLSIKLKFSEYVPGQRFYGLKRLNFHSMESDMSRMNDNVSHALFREAGVVAPRTAYARVVVNGELLGLFAVVEQIDGTFAKRNFPDGGQGNLYKEVWPLYNWAQPYIDALKTNETVPNADKMVRFAAAIDAASDATYESVLTSWTDVDMLMNMVAVGRLIENWDGIVAWYCVNGPCFNHNYYWYEATDSDFVWLVPWDVDNTFQWPAVIRSNYGMPDWDEIAPCNPIPIFLGIRGLPPTCDKLIRGMSTVLRERYVAATQAQLAGNFQTAALHARIDRLAGIIQGAVAEDPNGPSVAEWQAAVQRMKDNTVQIRAYVESKIGL